MTLIELRDRLNMMLEQGVPASAVVVVWSPMSDDDNEPVPYKMVEEVAGDDLWKSDMVWGRGIVGSSGVPCVSIW